MATGAGGSNGGCEWFTYHACVRVEEPVLLQGRTRQALCAVTNGASSQSVQANAAGEAESDSCATQRLGAAHLQASRSVVGGIATVRHTVAYALLYMYHRQSPTGSEVCAPVGRRVGPWRSSGRETGQQRTPN